MKDLLPLWEKVPAERTDEGWIVGRGACHLRSAKSSPSLIEDFLANAVEIHSHPVVVEPDHVEAEPLEIIAAPNIGDAALVLLAIEFDNQVRFEAGAIGDVVPIGCWRLNLSSWPKC